MKKGIITLVLILVILLAGSAHAQNLEATKQYLQTQLEIIQLQSTLDALQNSGGSSSQNSGGSGTNMYTWGQQNSAYSSTPTPFNYSPQPSAYAVTKSNFPQYARPLVPSGPPPVWNKPSSRRLTEITVGDAGQYRTLSEAAKHIPDNADEVLFTLVSDTDEPQAGVSIPLGKKISSVRIASNNGNKRTVWPADRSVWFFCNGIPLIIDKTVEFAKPSMIMGGICTYSGHNVESPESTIIVNGKAYWVYAGGQSDREGHSSTVNRALVIVNGEVDRVYAGGRAIWGETFVHNATVVVNGTANEVYCSGYTENTSARSTVGRADMKVYGWYSKFGLGLGQGELVLQDPTGCYQ